MRRRRRLRQPQEAPPSLAKGMANRDFWMISISFGCYNLVVMAMCTFLPVFLEVVRGYSKTYDNGVLMNAGFVTAFIMAASIFSGPAGGSISDRLGKRKIMILIPYILMTLTFLFPFTIGISMIPCVYDRIWSIVGGPIAPVLLAAVPEVARKPSTDRHRHVCSGCGPEYRDVYRPFTISPDSGGVWTIYRCSSMGHGRLLDDSFLPGWNYCNLFH